MTQPLQNEPIGGEQIGSPTIGPPDPFAVSTPPEFGSAGLTIPNGPAPYLPNPASLAAPPPPVQPDQNQHHGIFGWLENAGAKALDVLNAPLRDVQHLYRYFHDVWATQGWLPALAELGVAAGVGVLTGGVGDVGLAAGLGLGTSAGILAGTATAQAEANITYRHSWKATADGAVYKDPATGRPVSFGRDLASLIGYITGGSRTSTVESGIADAVFDFSLDPLMQLGMVARGARAGEFAADRAANTNVVAQRARNVLDQMGVKTSPGYAVYRQGRDMAAQRVAAARASGELLENGATAGTVVATRKPMVTASDLTAQSFIDAVNNNPRVKMQLAGMINQDPGKVMKAFPQLGDLAPKIAKAKTVDDAASVIAHAINNNKFSFEEHGIPSFTITRRVLGNDPLRTPSAVTADLMHNKVFSTGVTEPVRATLSGKAFEGMPREVPTALGKQINKVTSYTPFSMDSALLDISNRVVDPTSQDFPEVVYKIARHSMLPKDARSIQAKAALAETTAERVAIYKNTVLSAILADGVDPSDPFVVHLNETLPGFLSRSAGGLYGIGPDGEMLRNADEHGMDMGTGLLVNHTGKLPIPDFREWRKAVANSGKPWQRILVNADDYLYRHLTTRYFKQLVLISMGFATRVAFGELIPGIMKLSPKQLGEGMMASRLASETNYGDLLADAKRQVSEGNPDPLIGLRARVAGGDVGVIKSYEKSGSNGRAVLQHVDGTTSSHRFSDLRIYHRDLDDVTIKRISKEVGIKVTKEEVPHIKAAVGKALWMLGKALTDEDYRTVALMNTLKLGGHTVVPALDAAHDYIPGSGFGGGRINENVQGALARIAKSHPGEVAPFSVNGESKWLTFSKHFQSFSPEELQHPFYWQQAIKEAQSDPGVMEAAKAYVAAIKAGKDRTEAFSRAFEADRAWVESDHPDAEAFRNSMAGHHWNPDLLSTNRVKLFEGLVYGLKSKNLNLDLAEKISNHELPLMDELADVPLEDRPVVKGREVQPLGGTEMPTTMDKAVAQAWRPIQATINFLSRQPLYTAFTVDEFKGLKSWIDAGIMTRDEAHNVSMLRAMHRMLPIVHNTMMRSQLHIALANVFPFAFAQEQVYRRYLNGLMTNPVAAREATMELHGLYMSGAVQADAQGNKYLTLPGAGDLGTLASVAAGLAHLPVIAGIPDMFQGDLISLKSVAPESIAPSVAPLIAVPLKALADHWHVLDPFVRSVIGGVAMDAPMRDELIPNATIRRLWEALDPAAQTQTFATTYMQVMQYSAHKALQLWDRAEKIDPNALNPEIPRSALDPLAQQLMAQADTYFPLPGADPQVQTRALQKMKNTARILMMTKTAIGAVSPLAPVMEAGDFQLRQDVLKSIQQNGLVKGIQLFMDAHPDATPDTVFMSQSTVGTNLPATKQALDWLNNHWGLVQQHPLGAAYLMPQDPGAYNDQAYQEELQAHLRQRRTPQEFMDAIYQAEGNSVYQPNLQSYEQLKKQTYGDSYSTNRLNNLWAQTLQNLAYQNPVWYENQFSGKGYTTAIKARDDLLQALADGSLPNSPQTAAVVELEKSYRDYLMAASQAASGMGSMTSGQLGQSWKQYIDDFVTANPWSYGMAYNIYRRLVADAPYG